MLYLYPDFQLIGVGNTTDHLGIIKKNRFTCTHVLNVNVEKGVLQLLNFRKQVSLKGGFRMNIVIVDSLLVQLFCSEESRKS